MTTDAEILEAVHYDEKLSTEAEMTYAKTVLAHVKTMSPSLRSSLRVFFTNGPLFDGDVPSKTERTELVEAGYVAKIVVKGEEGFNACTYRGSLAHRMIMAGA